MTVRISGTNTTAAPGFQGGDSDTGIRPGTNEIEFVTGGSVAATFNSSGNLAFPDGQGIDFSASEGGNASSSIFNDYEEGTWSPVGNIDLSGAVTSYYIKIGRFVTVTTRITFPASSSSTTVNISGLPFNVDDNLSNSAMANAVGETSYTATDRPVATVETTDVIRFRIAGQTAMTYANLSGENIRFSVSYFSSS